MTTFSFEEANNQSFSFEEATGKEFSFEEASGETFINLQGPVGAAVGMVETGLQMGTGLAAQSAGGLRALASPITGESAMEAIQGTQETFTYKPKTRYGQTFSEVTGVPFEQLGKLTESTGARAAEVTGSPLVGALVKAGLDVFGLAPAKGKAVSKGEVPPSAKAPPIKTEIPPVPETPPVDLSAPTDLPKYAGNINLERISAPEDIKTSIDNISKEYAPQMEEARRGKISFEETKNLADLVGLTQEELLKRRKGQAFNAEEAFAARTLLVDSATKLSDLAKQAASGAPEDLLNFQAHLNKHVAIQQQVSGLTAEAGRALSQFRIFAEASGQTPKAIKNIIESSGKKRLEDIAGMISSLEDPTQVSKFAKEAYKARTSDVLLETWINALLSGPQTHAVNIVSNALVNQLTGVEHLVAAGIGKLHGGEKVAFREATARAVALVRGGLEGSRLATEAFLKEQPSDLATKVEVSRRKAISAEGLGLTGTSGKVVDVIGQGVRLPSRFLMAEDEFFKGVAKRQEINALAVRQGIEEGLSGKALAERTNELINNPSPEILDKAASAAQYQTFTNPLGDIGQAILGLAESHPAMRIVLPFITTPTNIVKFSLQRSPLAPLFKDVRSDINAGGARRDLALARIATGTSIGAVTLYLTDNGMITGGGPSKQQERSTRMLTGWRPYSIKVGDIYYSYSRLEPVGMLLGISADARDIWNKANEDESKELSALITMSISKNLTSKTWLRGMTDAINAISDPERYGERWINNFAGTAIPTGVAQYARIQDPYLRRAETIIEKIKSRVPGESETLLPRLNLWGEQVKLEGGLGPDILSPIYTSKDTGDKVSEEMVRLEVFPSMPKKKIDGVNLTPEEHNRFIEMAGKPAKKILDEIVNSPEYDQLPDFARRELIEKVIESWRTGAAGLMKALNPELIQGVITNKLKKVEK